MVLKGLSLVSDLMSNEATNQVLKLDKSWCALQGSEGLYGQTSDLDHIERLVQSLGKYFFVVFIKVDGRFGNFFLNIHMMRNYIFT